MPDSSGITPVTPPGPVPEKKPRGRTRSKEAEDAVLNAAFKLLSEQGIQATTVDAIAAESKVSKATIYKWWPNRAAIIMSAFLRESLVAIPYPDELSFDTVIDRLKHMSEQFVGPLGRMMAALIAEGQMDPAVATEFREGYINARRAEGVRIVQSSIDQGVVRDADPQAILDVLYAPLYYRLMVGHQPLTPAFVREYLELAMHGILRDDAPAAALKPSRRGKLPKPSEPSEPSKPSELQPGSSVRKKKA
ncbi:MAG: TetR/AcrR family transcriptional regulator [Comamonadaceae bacterium]|nr:MAG: TetR/AcrR family transcriptional regulator [Comamonadaceae bacterium]